MKHTIRIREAISADLALRNRADAFFDEIEKSTAQEIIVDFAEIKSISRSFAQQFQARKERSKKKIEQISVPEHVEKMFSIVKSSGTKKNLIDSHSIPVMTF